MTYYTIYDTYNMLLSGSPSIAQQVPTASTVSDSNNDDTDTSALSSSRPIDNSDEKHLDHTCNLKTHKRPRAENNPNGARNSRKRGKKKSLASSLPLASSSAEDSCSLFVRGLPRYTKEEALSDFFAAMFLRVGSTSAYPRCFIRRHKDDARVVISDPSDVTWALKFGDRLFRGVELEFLPWKPKTSPTFGGKPSNENESLGHYVPNNFKKESASTATVESEFPDGRCHKDDSRSVLSDNDQENYTPCEIDINSSHVVSEETATHASHIADNVCQKCFPRASASISEPFSSFSSRHTDDERVVFPDADQANNLRCNDPHSKERNAALSSSAYKGSSKWDQRAPSEMHELAAAASFVRPPRDNIRSDISDHDQGYYGSSDNINHTFNAVFEGAVANTSHKGHANACTIRGEALPSFSSLCKDKYDSNGIQNDKDRNGVDTSSSYHVLDNARATTSLDVTNTNEKFRSSTSCNASWVAPSCFTRRRKRNARVVFSDDVQVHSLEYDGSYGTCRNLSNVLKERVGVSAFTTVRESEEARKDGTHISPHVGADVSRVAHHEGSGNEASQGRETAADNEVVRLREELRLAQEKYQRDLMAAQAESEKKLSQKETDFIAQRASIHHKHEQDILAVQKRLDSSEKEHTKEKSELVRRLTDAKEQLKLLQDLMEKQQKDKDTLQVTLNKQKEEFKKNLKQSYAKKFLYAKDQIASDTSALTREIGTLKKQLDAANKKIATLSSLAHENSQRKQSDTTTKKSTEHLNESSKTMMAWKIKTEETSTKISELETKLLEAKKENEKLMKENEEALKNQKESFAKLKASSLQEKKSLVKKYTSEKQVLQQQIEQLTKESDQRRESSAESLEYSRNVDIQVLQEQLEQLTKEKQYMEQKNIDTTISMSKQITASFDQKELLREQLKREKSLRLAAEAHLHSLGSMPGASSNSPRLSAGTTRIKRSNSPPTLSNDTSKNDAPADFGDYDV